MNMNKSRIKYEEKLINSYSENCCKYFYNHFIKIEKNLYTLTPNKVLNNDCNHPSVINKNYDTLSWGI